MIAADWRLAQTGELYDDVAASLLRAFSGFLISVVLIVPLGLAVGWYTRPPHSELADGSALHSRVVKKATASHFCPAASISTGSPETRRTT